MKTKKLIPLLVSALMVLLFAGCGKTPKDAIEIRGIVIEVNEDNICICPDKESQEKINSTYVQVKLLKNEKFVLGDLVKVSYDEAITELTPTQLVHVYSITKLESNTTFSTAPYQIKLTQRAGATDTLIAPINPSAYNWSYAAGVNIIADAISPLDPAILDLKPVSVDKDKLYFIDVLVFPESIALNRYNKSDVGNYEKGPEETIVLKEKDKPFEPFSLEPDSIYVLSAYWPEELQCHGTAMYYFITD